jgi:hypothetical protein
MIEAIVGNGECMSPLTMAVIAIATAMLTLGGCGALGL